MTEKIRVVCGQCQKRLAVPAAAAGKKVRCPGCNGGIRVPASVDEDFGDDPYESTVPAAASGLPPRAKRGAKKGSGKKGAKQADATDGKFPKAGSKKIYFGAVIFFASIVSNLILTTMMGPPPNTAEGRGRAFGQGLAALLGIIAGIVMMILGFLANRKEKRR